MCNPAEVSHYFVFLFEVLQWKVLCTLHWFVFLHDFIITMAKMHLKFIATALGVIVICERAWTFWICALNAKPKRDIILCCVNLKFVLIGCDFLQQFLVFFWVHWTHGEV